jgi:alpha-tubulin suppressor-like RCC1 family protein
VLEYPSIGARMFSMSNLKTLPFLKLGGISHEPSTICGQFNYGAMVIAIPLLVVCMTSVAQSPITGGVAKIATGGSHTCLLTTTGGVKCWGNNTKGAVGDNSYKNRTTPSDVFGLSSGIAAITAGGEHACALSISGGVKCWGGNTYGQLGNGKFTNRRRPVDVVGLTSGVTSISAGARHTCAVTSSGGLRCWGNNLYHQLGDGSLSSQSTPAQVIGLAANVAAATAGENHTCALTTTGGVKCWGYSPARLGIGSGVDGFTPADVIGLTSGVTAISAGVAHTCALMTSGGVKCWGYNGYAQLGDGTGAERYTPVDVIGLSSGVVAISAGAWHTCAVTSGGGGKCWGYNEGGQLGDGSQSLRFTAVDVSGLTTGVISISAVSNYAYNTTHTCAVIAGGGAKCWGENYSGQLGIGSTWPNFSITPGYVIQVPIVPISPYDLNGDGKSDLLLRNTNTGELYAFLMNGLTVTGGGSLYGPGNGFTITHTADFNGDGNADLLLRSITGNEGSIVKWLMNGNSVLLTDIIAGYWPRVDYGKEGFAVTHAVGGTPSNIYTYTILQHPDGRTISVNEESNYPIRASTNMLTAGTGWRITHVADFDDNGQPDYLLTHVDGSLYASINGDPGSYPWGLFDPARGFLLLGPNSGWSVSHVADFNGDGTSDLALRHTDGTIVLWLMGDTGVIGGGAILGANSGWSISHTADLNGDGKSDLLLRHSDGRAIVWLMNGVTATAGAYLLPAASGWTITHTLDLNGDKKADLLLRHVDGTIVGWLMNGTAITAGAPLVGPGSIRVIPEQ